MDTLYIFKCTIEKNDSILDHFHKKYFIKKDVRWGYQVKYFSMILLTVFAGFFFLDRNIK